uniref:Uncharacterized protein n=1 Tax=Triticum urartu TaxID=4572 RepID=A0A8R7K2G3_TRIUA
MSRKEGKEGKRDQQYRPAHQSVAKLQLKQQLTQDTCLSTQNREDSAALAISGASTFRMQRLALFGAQN